MERRQLVPSNNVKPVSLLAADVPTTFQGHSSDDIFNALAAHAGKMNAVSKEFNSFAASPDTTSTFQGHDSSEIADAIRKYVSEHQGEGWPSDFGDYSAPSTSPAGSNINAASALPHTAAKSISQLATIDADGNTIFSLATLLQTTEWVRIIFCIIWIITGLLLLFFGWSACFWGSTWSLQRGRIDEKANRGKKRNVLLSGPVLQGGVEGAVIGFLFLSFFTVVVASAICAKDGKSLSSAAIFSIWLAPGLLGAALAGHFRFVARTFTGLAAGPCLTLILTAMFGIHTLLIRAILIAIFTTLVTGPLLIPRRNTIHFHLINACTSIVGIVTFLDGVALYAPPTASSAAWIDLWVLLFAPDKCPSQASATRKWGTSAFKGYIAGAVLGAVVGFLFELLLHKHASEDPEAAWNDYLGAYTQKFENGAPDSGDRAGSFEPAPSGWQRFTNLFSSPNKPASYGNIPGGQRATDSPLTERPAGVVKKARRARRSKGSGPAKFEALGKREHDLEGGNGSDSDETEYDSDDSTRKLKSAFSKDKKGVYSATNLDDEEQDLISPLSKLSNINGSGALENYRGYALPRPPSYRTDSQGGSSTLSGTTANSRGSETAIGTPTAEVEKPFNIYRDGDASPSSPSKQVKRSPRGDATSPPTSFQASPPYASNGMVPATPSLINAINRIQVAQAQAKAWQDAKKRESLSGHDHAPYGNQPLSPTMRAKEIATPVLEGDKASSVSATGTDVKDSADTQDLKEASKKPGFNEWWNKEMAKDAEK